ncbi:MULTISPECIES: hypothetical protein [Nocardia]|uniref:hypothetical protein n=1 Tax=Nocardia TaxID=1817 RepID=UPI000D687DF7|nr:MULTISPECIES: hypothetical protein [Nocardia]
MTSPLAPNLDWLESEARAAIDRLQKVQMPPGLLLDIVTYAKGQAALVDRVRLALADHPRCDVHPDADEVSCGWKRAVADVQHALEHGQDIING